MTRNAYSSIVLDALTSAPLFGEFVQNGTCSTLCTWGLSFMYPDMASASSLVLANSRRSGVRMKLCSGIGSNCNWKTILLRGHCHNFGMYSCLQYEGECTISA